MTRAVPDAPATHFRLSADSWALIAEAYRNGATARQLAARWKVSPTTIYRYACRDGFTKKARSDAVARAHAQAAVEEEEAGFAALGLTADYNEARRLTGMGPVVLSPPLPTPAAAPPDARPDALKQRALEDMAGALAAGRVAEAERLARLTLTLERLAAIGERAPADRHADDRAGGADDEDVDDEDDPTLSPPRRAFLRDPRNRIDPSEPWGSPAREAMGRRAQAAAFEETKLAEGFAEQLWPLIKRVAEGMLGDRSSAPAIFSNAVLRWRADTFGPEVARRDHDHLFACGVGECYYDEAGAIREGWNVWTRTMDPGER